MIDMRKYVHHGPDITLMSRALDVRAVQVVMEAITLKMAEINSALIKTPQRNDQDLTRDVVHQLGQLQMARWVLDLPREATEMITRNEKLGKGELR